MKDQTDVVVNCCGVGWLPICYPLTMRLLFTRFLFMRHILRLLNPVLARRYQRRLPSRYWLVLLLFLVACGEEIDTPGESLRMFAERLEPAFIDESYSATIRVVGGLSPYSFRISDGELPEGLSLQSGTIRGTPTELGRETFTVTVSDANLSTTFEEFTLEVIEAPPANFALDVPTTDVSERFTIRASVEDARDLRALRTLLAWDSERFEYVAGSVRARRNDVLIFENFEDGNLNVDVAILGESLNGNASLFEVTLEPLETNTIEVTARTEFRSDFGDHAFSRLQAGVTPREQDEQDDTERDDSQEDDL